MIMTEIQLQEYSKRLKNTKYKDVGFDHRSNMCNVSVHVQKKKKKKLTG